MMSSGSSVSTSVSGGGRKVLRGHRSSVQCCAVHQDQIITAGYDQMLRVWNANSGKEIYQVLAHEHMIQGLDVIVVRGAKKDKVCILTASWDKTAKVFRLLDGQQELSFQQHTNRVRCVQGISSLQLVASGDDDGKIFLWEVKTGAVRHCLRGHHHFIHQILLIPPPIGSEIERLQLLSCSSDDTLRLWSVDTGKEVQLVTTAIKGIRCVTTIWLDSHRISQLQSHQMNQQIFFDSSFCASDQSAMYMVAIVGYTGGEIVAVEVSSNTIIAIFHMESKINRLIYIPPCDLGCSLNISSTPLPSAIYFLTETGVLGGIDFQEQSNQILEADLAVIFGIGCSTGNKNIYGVPSKATDKRKQIDDDEGSVRRSRSNSITKVGQIPDGSTGACIEAEDSDGDEEESKPTVMWINAAVDFSLLGKLPGDNNVTRKSYMALTLSNGLALSISYNLINTTQLTINIPQKTEPPPLTVSIESKEKEKKEVKVTTLPKLHSITPKNKSSPSPAPRRIRRSFGEAQEQRRGSVASIVLEPCTAEGGDLGNFWTNIDNTDFSFNRMKLYSKESIINPNIAQSTGGANKTSKMLSSSQSDGRLTRHNRLDPLSSKPSSSFPTGRI